MSADLYHTTLPIRDEMFTSHQAALDHWSSAGTWWTAAERVAVVDEVRAAWDAPELPPWTAPSMVDGLIADDHLLPSAAIDVIWRLTNHVTTLTPEWYASFVPELLSPQQYVEIVGLVAQATMIDRFADGLGIDRLVLPTPEDGEPSRDQPPGAAVDTHWVPTAPIIDSSWNPTGESDVPNVRKALSLVAGERIMQWVLIDAHYVPGGALADDFAQGHWSLDRPQIELLGARTSAVNECFY
jgi:hypothetical protein